jgi:hypothetical protein
VRFACLNCAMFLCGILLFTSCGPHGEATAIVRGKVTYAGKPVPNGTVNFIPDRGPSATGEIQPDGSYTLMTYKAGDGAVIGAHKVIIVAMQDMNNRLPENRTPLPPPIVPVKYTSLATSDLTADVQKKENTINFDLKDEK